MGSLRQLEQYKAQLAQLRRMQFGRSSEKLDAQIQQLELMLEDLEEGEAARTALAERPGTDLPRRERRQPVRRPLPDRRHMMLRVPTSARRRPWLSSES